MAFQDEKLRGAASSARAGQLNRRAPSEGRATPGPAPSLRPADGNEQTAKTRAANVSEASGISMQRSVSAAMVLVEATPAEQLKRLARLEAECAQRAAGEARAADLVEQMRLKVQQFQRQNGTNMASAEAELSRLSDDLQRALHRQHSLEAHVQEAEERLAAMRLEIYQLTKDRDVAAIRRRKHEEESEQLQRRAHEERIATDAALLQLHESAVEAERLRAEIARVEDSKKCLQSEVRALQSQASRRRKFEKAELLATQQRLHAIIRHVFAAFKLAYPVARMHRRRLQSLQHRIRHSMTLNSFSTWNWITRAWIQWRCRSLEKQRLRLHRLLATWAHATKWWRRWRRRVVRCCLLGWQGAVQRIVELREWRTAKALVGKLFQMWSCAAWASRQLHARQMCTVRIRLRRVLRSLIRMWMGVTNTYRETRKRTQAFQDSKNLAAKQLVLACLRNNGRLRHRLKHVAARIGMRCVKRITSLVLHVFSVYVSKQCRIKAMMHSMPKRRLRADREQLLPAAIRGFQMAVMQTRLANSRGRPAMRRRVLETAVWLLPLWHAVAAWERSNRIHWEKCDARRRRWGVRRWRAWICAEKAQRRSRSVSGELYVLRAAAAVRGRLHQWSKRVQSQRIRTSRSMTVTARNRLSVCRRALTTWDAAVRIALIDDCSNLVGQAEAIGEATADLEARQGALEESQRCNDLAYADLSIEVQEKSRYVASLWAQVEESRAQNAELFTRLDEDRSATEALSRQVEQLRGEQETFSREGEPRLTMLESQLAEALEVQGSLRFALLRSEAEAENALRERNAAETREAELRTKFDNSRRAYVEAIDGLDRRAVGLTKEGWEAQHNAERLEKMLESTSFRMRMCDLELQRWEVG